jgi:GT2 family glycosyltransferase
MRVEGEAAPADLVGASPDVLLAQRAADGAALEFRECDQPKVSVVVPVFGNWALTRRCLGSLAIQRGIEQCEVIVVDDASRDRSRRFLSRVTGIRVIANERNLGFTLSADRGARAARGALILFLNNDTVMLPGCLEAMVEALEDASIGAGGAKLIYPDGTLQECGALVWRDGTGWNIGRGAGAGASEYQFRREVDYCSAAALMVRSEALRGVGFFDERFAPGYYEDADLCFSLRRMGWRVVAIPRAVVVHLEGMTHGTESRPGALGAYSKASQEVNRSRFVAKWESVLAFHRLVPESRVDAEVKGSALNPQPVVLVADYLMPTPDRDAGSQRMLWLLDLIARRAARVTLVLMDGVWYPEYGDRLRDRGIEVQPLVDRSLASLLNERRGLYQLAVLSRRIVADPWIELVRKLQPEATIVFDTVDLESLRLERESAFLREHGEAVVDADVAAIRRSEIRLFHESDYTAAVTEAEAARIRELCPDARVIVLPTVHTVRPAPPPFAGRRGLLFIGGFNHRPNVDGVAWFVREILPRVRERMDATLTVVGPDAPQWLIDDCGPSVTFTGWLPDAAPAFDAARLFVAPLRYGAGMKGKVGHAMSMGLPVVTTSVGAEGMDLTDGVEALIRDAPEPFADAVTELMDDEALWTKLSMNGRRAVAERWSPGVIAKRLAPLFSESAADGAGSESARWL